MLVKQIDQAEMVHMILAAIVSRNPDKELVVTEKEVRELKGAMYIEAKMSDPVQPHWRVRVLPREALLEVAKQLAEQKVLEAAFKTVDASEVN